MPATPAHPEHRTSDGECEREARADEARPGHTAVAAEDDVVVRHQRQSGLKTPSTMNTLAKKASTVAIARFFCSAERRGSTRPSPAHSSQYSDANTGHGLVFRIREDIRFAGSAASNCVAAIPPLVRADAHFSNTAADHLNLGDDRQIDRSDAGDAALA